MIFDFSHAQSDLIDLAAIDAVVGGTDDAFHLVAQFTGTAGELMALDLGGVSIVSGDVNGDGVGDFSIQVLSPPPLGASDFLL